uniref:Chromo domain-containing protein n=1 Tax=Arcella intermedia TaxID=1963864 RepID=A0A6B2LA16_9EUKA
MTSKEKLLKRKGSETLDTPQNKKKKKNDPRTPHNYYREEEDSAGIDIDSSYGDTPTKAPKPSSPKRSAESSSSSAPRGKAPPKGEKTPPKGEKAKGDKMEVVEEKPQKSAPAKKAPESSSSSSSSPPPKVRKAPSSSSSSDSSGSETTDKSTTQTTTKTSESTKSTQSTKGNPPKKASGSSSSSDSSEADNASSSDEGDSVDKVIAIRGPPNSREVLVKLKERSYKDCKWVHPKEIPHMNGSKKYDFFLKKNDIDSDEEVPEVASYFPASYTTPDRLVDYRPPGSDDGDGSYLIKWQKLPYSDATWESEKWVKEKFPLMVQYYKEYNAYPEGI